MQLADRRGGKLSARRSHASEQAGFTLLEILAVILIGALLLSFMVPNISALKSRALRADAKRIISMVDLGRQRAVVTRIPHRLYLDMKRATFGLQWMAPSDEANPQNDRDASGLETGGMISLAPPPVVDREFRPLPGQMGRRAGLGDGVGFAKIKISSGTINSGEAYVDFYRDGTSSFTVITLDDLDGRTIQLEILPLADAVRIHDEEI